MPMKGPLLCSPFWVPDLINPIQLFNRIIKEAVVTGETVWVTAGEEAVASATSPARPVLLRMGVGVGVMV